MFLKTDRDRQRQTKTGLLKRRLSFAVRWSFAIVAVFAVFAVYAIRRSPFAFSVCRLRLPLILRNVDHEHATRLPDFADDAVPVKLWTAQPESSLKVFC